jgi:hypothetical protein
MFAGLTSIEGTGRICGPNGQPRYNIILGHTMIFTNEEEYKKALTFLIEQFFTARERASESNTDLLGVLGIMGIT